ncbi:MAG: hypothetical protein ACKVWV_03180 [Planctomycetota bacterium]
MQAATSSLGLFVAGFFWLTSPSAATTTALAPAKAEAAPAQAETSIFGAPLFVNGRRITDDEIKLYLIHGPYKLAFELNRIGLVIQEELRRQAAEAAEMELRKRESEKPFATPEERQKALATETAKQLELCNERYRVTDDEFNEEFARTLEEFKKKYPILNLQNEIVRAYRDIEWYKKELRQSLLFDKVFLPNNPEEWPIVTIEAVLADSGEPMLEDAKLGYKLRKEWADNHNETKVPKEEGIYLQVLRQIVRDAMFNLIDFRSNTDGLPDDQILWADTNGDGTPELQLKTEDLWKEVAPITQSHEIEEAKRWLIAYYSTHDRLKKEGALISAEELRAGVREYEKQFEGTHINLALNVTEMRYFPSVETFKDFYHLHLSFKKAKEPELAATAGGGAASSSEVAPVLRKQLDRTNRMLGLGQVDAEFMLVSAFDYPKGQWKPDGWSWAEKRAKELKAQVDDYQKKLADERAKEADARTKGEEYKSSEELLDFYRWWTQLMDDNSEYWDPPPPEGQGAKQSMISYKMKGRFGEKYRNDLLTFLEETEFSEWVRGGSLTDKVFFDQEVGTVAGPFKGPRGYYLTYVKRRKPATQPLILSNPRHQQLLKDDYLRCAFIDYARESIAQAEVKGFDTKNW